MLWQVCLVLLIVWSVYYRWSRRRIYQLAKQIQCDLISLPIIGHAYLLIGDGTVRMKAMQTIGREAINQGGLTHAWLGPRYFIVLADVDILEVILKTCLQKDDLVSFVRLGIGNGSLFAPVPIWRPRRKVLSPTFSPKNLKKFFEVFSKQSSIMVSLLKQAPKGSFPIWDYFITYTMDSVCETTFGFNVNAQQNKNQPFLKAFETCTRLIVERMSQPWMHSTNVYQMTPQYATAIKNKAVLGDFVGQIIKSKRQVRRERGRKDATDATNKKMKSFIEQLIEDDDENGFNDMELQEEALVMVMAGTDTTAVCASFTAVMLSRHQDIQEQVYQEVMDVLGDTDRPIVTEDLSRLKYLDAVIKETLRLYPPVPVLGRKVETDVILPSGLTLVDGCGILINVWAVHRNPKYWGPNADEFRPERFFEQYNTRAFMAFSSGPRNCLGYRYAMMSMKTVLASLIRQYRVLPAEEDVIHDGLNTKYKPMQISFELMMKDVNKFIVKLESR